MAWDFGSNHALDRFKKKCLGKTCFIQTHPKTSQPKKRNRLEKKNVQNTHCLAGASGIIFHHNGLP